MVRGQGVFVLRRKGRGAFKGWRLWAAIAVACFAYAQTAVAAHEAVYGSEIHFHDDQLCAISLHGDRHDHLDVPPAAGALLTLRTAFIFRPADTATCPRAAVRAPRARGPPHHSATA